MLYKKSPMIRGCPKENFQAKLRTDGLFCVRTWNVDTGVYVYVTSISR